MNVARVDDPAIDPGGNAADFPIFCALPRANSRGFRPVSLRNHGLPTKTNGLR